MIISNNLFNSNNYSTLHDKFCETDQVADTTKRFKKFGRKILLYFFIDKITIKELLNYIEINSICKSEDSPIILGLQSGTGGEESKIFMQELKKKLDNLNLK